MKKPVILLSLCIITAFQLSAQKWTPKDRKEFIESCIDEAKAGMSLDSAKFYCNCMQMKIEAKYPDLGDAGKITAEDMQKPEMLKEIKSCMGTSTWTDNQRKEFVEGCIGTSKEAFGEAKAKGYCECMLSKVEVLYPDFSGISEITKEKLKTPEWKARIQACLEGL